MVTPGTGCRTDPRPGGIRYRPGMKIDAGIGFNLARAAAEGESNVSSQLEGRDVVRVIYVPGRLLNIVVK